LRRFYVSVAKSYVGRNVNLHLKDHSVIINVLLTDIIKDNERNPRLRYRTPKGCAEIPIKDVDWVQPLNPLFDTWREEKA